MRPALIFAIAAPLVMSAGAGHAADAQLSCSGDAFLTPAQTSAKVDVQLKVEGGLEAPGSITFAWARPEPSVPMELKSLTGDTLAFHGLAAEKDGAVVVADAQLNRATLALVLKIRRVGGGGGAENLTLETTCQRA